MYQSKCQFRISTAVKVDLDSGRKIYRYVATCAGREISPAMQAQWNECIIGNSIWMGWCKYGSGRISSSNNGSRMMNRSHSHRNLLWSNHWLVAFHKLTGTLLYSLFVSWSFCWQSNGRVDGFTMCTL